MPIIQLQFSPNNLTQRITLPAWTTIKIIEIKTNNQNPFPNTDYLNLMLHAGTTYFLCSVPTNCNEESITIRKSLSNGQNENYDITLEARAPVDSPIDFSVFYEIEPIALVEIQNSLLGSWERKSIEPQDQFTFIILEFIRNQYKRIGTTEARGNLAQYIGNYSVRISDIGEVIIQFDNETDYEIETLSIIEGKLKFSGTIAGTQFVSHYERKYIQMY